MMYFGLVAILVLILSVSIYSTKKQQGKSFSGKHAASVPLVMGAVIGTLVGGSSTVGTAQSAFASGFSAWWYTIGCSLGIILFGLFFSRKVYESEYNTLPEIVAARYGENCGVTMSLMAALGTLIGIVSQVLSGVALVTSILPVDMTIALLVFVSLVLLYVFFGGGISLGYMGILKTILMASGLGICGIVAYMAADKAQLFALPQAQYFNLFTGGVKKNLSQVISLIAGIITGQNYSSALITGRTYREGRKAILLSSIISPFMGLFCILVGFYMKLYHPEIVSSTALPLFIQLKMPGFIAGCLEGMLLLTLVGTTAGALYATSTITYRGLLKKFFRNETVVTRFLILFFILVVAFFVFCNSGDLILTWTFMGAGLRGAVSLFPLIFTLFVKKTLRRGYILSSMLAAPICTLLGKFLLPSIDILPIFYGLLGSIFFLILGLLDKRLQEKGPTSLYPNRK